MTASAPSKIAVAMSEHSARVGAGLSIIDSSIWVATITGLPWERHSSMISLGWGYHVGVSVRVGVAMGLG